MPELPDVEIVRRGLKPALVGHSFERVEQRRPDLRFPLPERFAARLRGHKVERLDRRAKYLLAHLSGGDVLLMHLGMTGRFTVHARGDAAHVRGRNIGHLAQDTGSAARHDHVVFHMKHGAEVTYTDPRRFGFMLLIPEAELAQHPLMHGLGVEPLGPELTPEYLARRAAGRAVDLKAFLSDQRVGRARQHLRAGAVSRWLARRVRPRARDQDGRPMERAPLGSGIGAVLGRHRRRAPLNDYRHADGALGSSARLPSMTARIAACARAAAASSGESCKVAARPLLPQGQR
jgi:formamidopyrimidine-DNA glycosylase